MRLRFKLTRKAFELAVDLRLPANGITVLYGPSGCGKTSVLRCVAGLERPRDALIQIDTQDPTSVWQHDTQRIFVSTHRRALGYVFQEASLFPHLDVRGNLAYGLKRARPGHTGSTLQQTPDQALDQAITLLGIGPLLTRSVGQLSGGERQRVAIARALATQPRLLLLDEPLAALDTARKQEVLPWLERLRDQLRIPMLYVSHASDEVARLADTLVLLKDGQALAHGPVAEVMARTDLPLALGEDASVLIQGVIDTVDATWHQCRVAFPGGHLWVREKALSIGRPVRVRVLARDVSVATVQPQHTSILNLLPCTLTTVTPDAHPSQAVLLLALGAAADGQNPSEATPLLARVTQRSVHALGLVPGQALWAQVKSAALMD